MSTYYDTLELQPGASQTEIKKAYFKLIKQHSPETDPKRFQEIREAYEHLKKEGGISDGPQFPAFSDPWAEKMMKQIDVYKQTHDLEMVRDACEEAWHHFPEELRFLYYLVTAQRECGNTGKSVKNAEQLVKKEPGNKWFRRELALSYQARGYGKKAFRAFEEAYEAGCRDNEFLFMYAAECGEFYEYERGTQLLFEVVRQDRKWTRDDISELFEAYILLLKFNHDMRAPHGTEITGELCQKLEQYKVYLADIVPDVLFILSGVLMSCSSRAECQAVKRVFEILRAACRTQESRECVAEFEARFDFACIVDDTRVCETLKNAYVAYCELQDVDDRTRKFALTDVQLCMLEERREILEQVEILRQDYPDFYGKLADFIRRLQAEGNIVYLKDSLLKTYRRLAVDYTHGYYYEKYPQEREKAEGIRISDGESGEPYVRGSRKIGRNDPCPCGSGKKYKQCCMRKGD